MSRPEDDDRPGSRPSRDAAAQQPMLSDREWLARGRELPVLSRPVPRPAPPSRRFTWGCRGGIVLAALFYSGLVIWTRADADQTLPAPAEVLFGLAVLVAAAALVEAWCWAGRPRFSASQSEALTADLSPEQKTTVRRMARGRGPEVVELRPRAGAVAWAQRQNNAVAPAFLALVNVGNLAQSTGTVAGLVLGLVILLISAGALGDALWLGHRVRLLGRPDRPDTELPQ